MERKATVDRRGELVRAAFHLIATRGLEGLRTRDVAAQVGINIATLHYYFATKEALIAGVVEHLGTQFAARRAQHLRARSPVDELQQLFKSHAARKQSASDLDVVMHEIMLRARRDEDVRLAFGSLLLGWRSAVEDIVSRGVKAGVLRDDVDANTVASVVTSFLIGADMQLGLAAASSSLDDAAHAFMAWLVKKRSA